MSSELIQLENQAIKAVFCGRTGAFLQLEDKIRGLSHITGPPGPPFVAIYKGEQREGFEGFSSRTEAEGLRLFWQLPEAELNARVVLQEEGLLFSFCLSQEAAGGYQAVEYPLMGGLRDQGDNTHLAHPWATGVLMKGPASFLPREGGLRFAPYPECFSGAPMQMMALYHKGQGGLYIAALDPGCHQKWFNAYTRGGALCLSHMYGFEDLSPGAEIRMPYALLLRPYQGDNWEQAAEIYRDFALTLPWSRKAKNRKNPAPWLKEEVGFCTFGINAGHDRSRWLKQYHEDIQSPALHVLGPDWTNRPQTYGSGVPGGMADWLPTRFNPHTLAAIRENGDRFAPFEFDFLVSLKQSDQQTLQDNLQRFPDPPCSHDGYKFNMLCPAQPFTKAFHRERDLQVAAESGADAMYYDISANNLIKICTREDHAHTPGGGHEIARAYQDIYEDTAGALREAVGRPIPLGTEQISEELIAQVDFYQARAWAQPAAILETWPFLAQMKTGQALMIPLFDYVYHDIGPLRMDGWGKLAEETGELFYYTLAKVYLWGGIYQLNHEYSPMEALSGQENPPQEHYFHFAPRGYAYSHKRARHLGLFASARLGDARRFWAYGRLLAAPEISLPRREYSWHNYNHAQQDDAAQTSGTYNAEAVFISFWQAPDGDQALFLANCDSQEGHSIKLKEASEALSGASVRLTRFDALGKARVITDFGMAPLERREIFLESLGLYMLEINRSERRTR